MRTVILGVATAATIMFSGVAAADDIQNKVKLQESLAQFLDARSTDGQLVLLDQNDSSLKTVYLAGSHPMIVPLKGGNYFLCADGYDIQGNEVQMDFLVKPDGEGFRVIDAMLNARASVKTIVESQ